MNRYQKLINEIEENKKKIDEHQPFSGELLKQLKKYYRIGLTYSSNALEGNSLTETETKVVLEDGLTVGGKPIKDYFEAIGHSKAYDYIFSIKNKKSLTEQNIKTLHYLFYQYIDGEEAGNYRKKRVFISGSEYLPPVPQKIPELMTKFVKELNGSRNKIHPIKLAARAHKEFVFIHPFIDGNGRVARLIMNLILLQYKYSLAIIPPVLRGDYINLLEKAHQDESDFIFFIAERVKETQKDYLRLLK